MIKEVAVVLSTTAFAKHWIQMIGKLGVEFPSWGVLPGGQVSFGSALARSTGRPDPTKLLAECGRSKLSAVLVYIIEEHGHNGSYKVISHTRSSH